MQNGQNGRNGWNGGVRTHKNINMMVVQSKVDICEALIFNIVRCVYVARSYRGQTISRFEAPAHWSFPICLHTIETAIDFNMLLYTYYVIIVIRCLGFFYPYYSLDTGCFHTDILSFSHYNYYSVVVNCRAIR